MEDMGMNEVDRCWMDRARANATSSCASCWTLARGNETCALTARSACPPSCLRIHHCLGREKSWRRLACYHPSRNARLRGGRCRLRAHTLIATITFVTLFVAGRGGGGEMGGPPGMGCRSRRSACVERSSTDKTVPAAWIASSDPQSVEPPRSASGSANAVYAAFGSANSA